MDSITMAIYFMAIYFACFLWILSEINQNLRAILKELKKSNKGEN